MAQYSHLEWHGDRVEHHLDEAAARGLRRATEHLLKISRDLVPHEEGTLERSGVASVDRSELAGAVSYDTVYAVRQHEELTWKHKPGRQAKYLEAPAATEADVLQGIIATEIRRATR
jgi:hypothetical protein